MLNEQEKIDRYLDGEMSDSEKNTFEQEIKNNKELSEQVALSKDLGAFFKERNIGLEQTLSNLGEEFFNDKTPQNTIPNADTDKPIFSKARFAIPFLLLLIVCIGGVWYFNNNSDTEKFEDALFTPSTSIKETEKMINEGMQEQGDSEKEGGEEIPKTLEEATEMPIKEEKLPNGTPTKSDDKPKENKPMARLDDKASFKENPILESLIRENVRSNEAALLVKKPTPNQIYKSKRDKIYLEFSGTVNTSANLEFIIYNNLPVSFDKDYKTLLAVLKSEKIGDKQFQLTFEGNVELKNGLYYYIVRKKSDFEILYISKFKVQ
jgi:hypothetical protein